MAKLKVNKRTGRVTLKYKGKKRPVKKMVQRKK